MRDGRMRCNELRYPRTLGPPSPQRQCCRHTIKTWPSTSYQTSDKPMWQQILHFKMYLPTFKKKPKRCRDIRASSKLPKGFAELRRLSRDENRYWPTGSSRDDWSLAPLYAGTSPSHGRKRAHFPIGIIWMNWPHIGNVKRSLTGVCWKWKQIWAWLEIFPLNAQTAIIGRPKSTQVNL